MIIILLNGLHFIEVDALDFPLLTSFREKTTVRSLEWWAYLGVQFHRHKCKEINGFKYFKLFG